MFIADPNVHNVTLKKIASEMLDAVNRFPSENLTGAPPVNVYRIS